ncbi:pentatricopeptide repeat-containing protein At3g03580 [Macadamia integrifolia]|uniref:pentatricopeptide repeat-containing protein At3g03580 n=1 Tax=Macadamia integrifolia TaxID=60698 RepID=UPI001C4E56C1|nr:pentatricopeptide repeat-containing protein At3g03580 [Macadamia integrifolia]
MVMRTRNLQSLARFITTSTLKRSTHVDVYSYNRTIDDLMKSGGLDSAVQLFESMPARDVISWNLVIAGHARHGFPLLAIDFFKVMVSEGVRESSSTFSSVLSICSNAGFHREGYQVHCRGILLGFDSNLFVGSALVHLYMSTGSYYVALKLFDELPERSLATWNLVLRGLCWFGRSDELELYGRMELDGIKPSCVTFSYLIHACGIGGYLDKGKQLHCYVIKIGLLQSNLFVANALVDLYSSCGSLIDARKSVEIIPVEDIISWNSIISIYADHGLLPEALEFFAQMQSWGKKPSVRSFVGLLNLASRTENPQFGKQVHGYVLKLGFEHGNVYVQSALIDMYGKCGEIERSVSLFEESPERTMECCNSLMTSLLNHNAIEDVIELFGLMIYEGVGLDEVTFSTTLKALSSSAMVSLTSCTLLHGCVVKLGFESDIAVLCSLIDVYSRCGHVELSSRVFKHIPVLNTFCFTSIIAGYARNGMGREGLEIFEAMIQNNVEADAITFLCVLTGCNYSGLVREGQLVFEAMKSVHGLCPDRRHYSCLVDLLGRKGLLEEAEELLKLAPVKGDSVMWSSLLRSCKVHQNEKVGRRAAKALIELKPDDPAAYLQALSFYSELGDSDTAEKIRQTLGRRKMRKDIGYSWIELNTYGYP